MKEFATLLLMGIMEMATMGFASPPTQPRPQSSLTGKHKVSMQSEKTGNNESRLETSLIYPLLIATSGAARLKLVLSWESCM